MAERMNGILKYEFGLKRIIPDLDIATKMVDEAVRLYNGRRLHRSLQMRTPNEAHRSQKHEYATYRKKENCGLTTGRNVDKSSGILKKCQRQLINVPVNLKQKLKPIDHQKWSTYFWARQDTSQI